MNLRISVSTLLVFIFIGCVSADKSNELVMVNGNDQGLVLSVEERTAFSTDNLVMLEFSMRNTSEDFLRFKDIKIDFPSEIEDQVFIVVGQDLMNWSEGIKNKVSLEQYNRSMVFAGISAVGGVTAVMSNDPKVQQLGIGALMAGSGAISIDQFLIYRDQLKGSKFADMRGLIPESHILFSPVSIPPGLFLNRFAVFQMKKDTRPFFHSLSIKVLDEKDEWSEFKAVFNPRLKSKVSESTHIQDLQTACLATGDSFRFKGKQLTCWQQCEKYYRGYDLRECRKAFKQKYQL